MTSHVVHGKIDDKMLPATLSEKVVEKLLREFLDYEGVVFSDDMQMGAITKHYGLDDAVTLAINELLQNQLDFVYLNAFASILKSFLFYHFYYKICKNLHLIFQNKL